MTYLRPLGAQIVLFLHMIGFGFLMGVGYDLVRLLRRWTSGERGLFIWDVLFGAVSAVLSFLYSLSLGNSSVRLHLLLAQALGFAAWYCLSAAVFRRMSALVTGRIRRFRGFVRRMFAAADRTLFAFGRKCAQPLKLFTKKSKILLKLYTAMVYNPKQ